MKKTLKSTTTLSINKANDQLTKLGNDIVTLDNAIDKKIGQVDGKMYDFSIEYAVRINSQYPNGGYSRSALGLALREIWTYRPP